jgi:hypothetical protein
MSFDPQNGHLLILDRGVAIPFPALGSTKIIEVNVQDMQITERLLPMIEEPLALLILSADELVIGDARDQKNAAPAELWRVERDTWQATALLTGVQPNPLIAPCAVVQMDGNLLVLDIGLRAYLPGFDSPRQSRFIRLMAEQATVYLVNLAGQTPSIVQACESRQLVFPTGMLLHQKILFICDQGEYGLSVDLDRIRVWRVLPHEFGVVIHFSLQRPTTADERLQIKQSISAIVEQEKPAHTLATMAYQM